jgi:hypothetical protein
MHPGPTPATQQSLAIPQSPQPNCWTSSAQVWSHCCVQQKSSIAQTQASMVASPQLGPSCGLQHSPGPPVSPPVLLLPPVVPSVVPVLVPVLVPSPVLVPVLVPSVVSVPVLVLVPGSVVVGEPVVMLSPLDELSPVVGGEVVGPLVEIWVVPLLLLLLLELETSVVPISSSVHPDSALSSASETPRARQRGAKGKTKDWRMPWL